MSFYCGFCEEWIVGEPVGRHNGDPLCGECDNYLSGGFRSEYPE